jgi:transcriptional regulator with XRE-family HTH domain
MMFSERLDLLLKEHNLSQATLANAIGYSQRTISKWCNGQADPSATAVKLCAQFFGVSADYLLGLED